MFVVKDKDGKESVRLSKHEQGLLAYSNIQYIKLQKMRKANVTGKELMDQDLAYANASRAFDEALRRGQ